jgi:hypothetical protein
LSGTGDELGLDLDPHDLPGAVLGDQQKVDRAEPGAHVEDPASGQVDALQQSPYLLRAAGR